MDSMLAITRMHRTSSWLNVRGSVLKAATMPKDWC